LSVADTITVRRMRFTIPQDVDPVIVQGRPEESFIALSLSLLLPYLEPYLIRTMKAALPQITKRRLADEVAAFIGQEGQHYRQHLHLNEAIKRKGFGGLAALEDELDRDYQRFSLEHSLRFNLAYAEGFEAFTTQLARITADLDMSQWQPDVADLFRWHLAEEVEHKNVAFDVYDHVCGGYVHRTIVGGWAQRHFLRWVLRTTWYLLHASGAVPAHGGAWASLRRSLAFTVDRGWRLTPKVLRTYLPGYSPHHIEVPQVLRDLAAHYSEVAVSIAGPPPSR
jgi:uncharacterized protein